MALFPRVRRFALLTSIVAGLMVASVAPVAAAEPPQLTEAERVIAIAVDQVGARWRFAATGPDEFDCSGLVTFAFREAGLLDRVGGKRRTAAGFYKYFNNLGLADRQNPRPGDIIIWGKNKHAGIYIGDGMAVSALTNPHGVSIHKVKGYVPIRLKAYLHVDLER